MDKQSNLFSDKIKIYAAIMIFVLMCLIMSFSKYFRPLFTLGGNNNQYLGWILAGFFIFLLFYSVRKRYMLMSAGSLNIWYSLHFYAGILISVLFIIHSEFSFNSPLLRIISFLMIFIFLNGIYGIAVHSFIPPSLLQQNIESDSLKSDTRKLRLEKLMNNWLNYHISASTVLFFLVILHILSYYYY